jgi:uncharacterized protein
MREIKKLFLVIISLAFLFTPVTALAASSNYYIEDEADLLSDQEEAQLSEYFASLSTDYKYYVVTTYSSGSNTDSKLESYYTSVYSSYDSGVAFIIDMNNREIYMSGYGEAQNKITNGDCYDITDNSYTYAKNGDYYNCIYKSFSQADTLLNHGFILRPMRYIVSLMVATILGFLLTFFRAMFERNEKRKSCAPEILLAGAIAGTSSIFDTQRVRRSSDSGRSSGGGFSGGGGGGFSGGGGGGGHSGGGHSF